MEQGTQDRAQPIALPERTRETLIALVKEQQRINDAINRTVATAQECLSVPDGWVLRDVGVGFEPPPAQAGEADGVRVAEIED